MENISDRLLNIITRGHERSVRAKKNIVLSLIFRGGTLGINLLLVPVLLHYMDAARYGIWLTVISFLSWFSFLDVGLGDGLRNRFAESKANNQNTLAREYVSTTYALLILIMGGFLVVVLSVNNLIPWRSLLNIPAGIDDNIKLLVIILFAFFALQIVGDLIVTVLVSDQKPAVQYITGFAGRALFLLAVLFLRNHYPPSLTYVALSYTVPTLVVLGILSLWFYTGRYSGFRPSLKYINWKHHKSLLNLGFKFFVIQIGVIVLVSTDNIIITQLFGPEQVSVYQIVGKYFAVIQGIFMVIVTPLWSATTEAYVKKEYRWIENIKKSYTKLFLGGCVILLIMLILSPYVYHFWIGTDFNPAFQLSLVWALFIAVQIYTLIYFFIINGVGNVQLELYAYLFIIVINIPLSIFLARNLAMGITGVILASTICHSLHLLYLPRQVRKIVTGKLHGLWAK